MRCVVVSADADYGEMRGTMQGSWKKMNVRAERVYS